jgi:hypothetical protein
MGKSVIMKECSVLDKLREIQRFREEVNDTEELEPWVYNCVNSVTSYIADVEDGIRNKLGERCVVVGKRLALDEAKFVESNIEVIMKLLDLVYDVIYDVNCNE